jgi:hypothetical protein
VGSTARALRHRALETIDVVDVSRNIIEATRLVYPVPGTHPLDDPRVRLHIEDGRFFLLATTGRFDLITAEPPPPNNAGVSSLYSREYFSLVRSRLAEGGIASYWLPAYQLRERDSQAIAAAFCAAFADCTLWSGSGGEWVLLGTRDARPATEEGFARQWKDPRVRPALEAFGFERPEDLGVTFLAGPEDLARWTEGVPSLDDDHPHRVSPETVRVELEPYLRFAGPTQARERFSRSSFVDRMWPEGLRERTLAAWSDLEPVLRAGWVPYGVRPSGLLELHDLLDGSRVRTGVLWMMGSNAFEEQAARAARARGVEDPARRVLGIAAMAVRLPTRSPFGGWPHAYDGPATPGESSPHLAATGGAQRWRPDGPAPRDEPGFAGMEAACARRAR